MKTLYSILLISISTMFIATSVKAQVNVAVISQEIALIQSKVGADIARQLIVIDKQIDAEFEPELVPLRSQAQQLNAEISALSPEVLRTRTDLMRREQDLRQKLGELANWKKRQMAATGEQARIPVFTAYETAVNSIISEMKIDILLDGSTVLFRNKDSDITERVIAKMDTVITTTVVTRVRVPRVQQPQQQAAPAAR